MKACYNGASQTKLTSYYLKEVGKLYIMFRHKFLVTALSMGLLVSCLPEETSTNQESESVDNTQPTEYWDKKLATQRSALRTFIQAVRGENRIRKKRLFKFRLPTNPVNQRSSNLNPALLNKTNYSARPGPKHARKLSYLVYLNISAQNHDFKNRRKNSFSNKISRLIY